MIPLFLLKSKGFLEKNRDSPLFLVFYLFFTASLPLELPHIPVKRNALVIIRNPPMQRRQENNS